MARHRFTLFRILAGAALAAAACVHAGTTTLYRTVDANGVVTYSDRPSPGARKVDVTTQPTSSPGATPTLAPPRATAPGVGNGMPGASQYASCTIASPGNEEMLVNTHEVVIRLDIEPALRPGHTAYLIYDGTRIDGGGTSFSLTDVDRGAHSVSAVVQDSLGNQMCQTPGITFYVSQPSLLQPNRPH